jgi:DNA-binding NarL/FixJ family response regulator
MGDSIKVGVIADQTGPLSPMGCAQTNVATLVLDEINASGGLLGRVVKRPRQLAAGLTERELEVLMALASGKTNKEIGEALGISAKTAGHHVQHIFDKTGARTRSAATVWAFERHLVQSA